MITNFFVEVLKDNICIKTSLPIMHSTTSYIYK